MSSGYSIKCSKLYLLHADFKPFREEIQLCLIRKLINPKKNVKKRVKSAHSFVCVFVFFFVFCTCANHDGDSLVHLIITHITVGESVRLTA